MTDAVEKGRGMPPARNYRISGDDILIVLAHSTLVLNQYCLGTPPKILFQQHRPKADIALTDE
jgi:hypothetical protein